MMIQALSFFCGIMICALVFMFLPCLGYLHSQLASLPVLRNWHPILSGLWQALQAVLPSPVSNEAAVSCSVPASRPLLVHWHQKPEIAAVVEEMHQFVQKPWLRNFNAANAHFKVNAHSWGILIKMATDTQIETKVLDGKAIAAEIRRQAKEELENLQKIHNKLAAKLVIVQVRP